MKDAEKSKDQLIRELQEMRSRLAEIEPLQKRWGAAGAVLSRSEESFRKIFDHSNDAIFVVDPLEDRIIDVNLRACEMLGFTSEELLAMPISAIHPDEMPKFRAFAKSVSNRGYGWTNELTCLTKLGKKLASEMSASVIDMSGSNYMIALVRDISKRKEAEEKLRKAHERMKADLEAAAEMQRSLLPSSSAPVEGARFAWEVRPCEQLAGDILNIFRLDEGQTGFYLLDVSGHGVAAALLSVAVHRVLSPSPGPTSLLTEEKGHGSRREIVSPAEVCRQLNTLFPMKEANPQYFTLIYGVLDLTTQEFRFSSAGHCAPVYLPPGGKAYEVAEYGFPIGLFEEAQYEEHLIEMKPSGRLYLYSDGLTDAVNSQGETFGKDLLIRLFRVLTRISNLISASRPCSGLQRLYL